MKYGITLAMLVLSLSVAWVGCGDGDDDDGDVGLGGSSEAGAGGGGSEAPDWTDCRSGQGSGGIDCVVQHCESASVGMGLPKCNGATGEWECVDYVDPEDCPPGSPLHCSGKVQPTCVDSCDANNEQDAACDSDTSEWVCPDGSVDAANCD